MTFEEFWRTYPVPGEFDAMDALDQEQWRALAEAAFEAGKAQ